jgi:hypothetical protein
VPKYWSNGDNYFTYYLDEQENLNKSVIFVNGETGALVRFSEYELDDTIIKM